MIDTITIKTALNKKIFKAFVEKFCDYINSHDFDRSKCKRYYKEDFGGKKIRKFSFMQELGVMQTKLIDYHKGSTHYELELDIKCSYLLESALFNPIGLMGERNMIEFIRKINNIIEFMSYKIIGDEDALPPFKYWEISRIDYAADIVTDDANHYINLFQRGFFPRSMKLHVYPTSCCFVNQRRKSFNFYNKTRQLKDKEGCSIEDDVLRIEVQCRRDYIKEICKYFNFNDVSLEFLSREFVADFVLKNAIKGTVGLEDFRTEDCIIRVLNNKREITRSKARELFKALEEFRNECYANARSSDFKRKRNCVIRTDFTKKAFKDYLVNTSDTITPEDFNNLQKAFKKANVSMVLIPKEWNISYLENPYKLIKENLN